MSVDEPDRPPSSLERDAADAERVRLFAVVRGAIALARAYRVEEGRAGGPREVACLVTVREARVALSRLRATLALPTAAGPGLAKSAPVPARGERKSS